MIHGRRLVLNFHGVGDIPPHVGAQERPFWLTLPGFVAILDAIVAISASSGRTIQITVDDGNESDITRALPVLLERRLIADFFVCAGRLGHPGYLNDCQIRELRAAGMRVGSHGWGHVNWRAADDAALDRELRVARRDLSDALGQAVDDIAVPFGSYDRRVIRALRRSGYRTVYTSDGGWADDGWMMPRVTWRAGFDVSALHELASSRPSTLQAAKRSLALFAKRLR